MSEINQTNGIEYRNAIPAADVAPAVSTPSGQKRILTKNLDARIAELERKIGSLADAAHNSSTEIGLPQKIAELADQIAKLDERVTKIAHAVAQSNLAR